MAVTPEPRLASSPTSFRAFKSQKLKFRVQHYHQRHLKMVKATGHNQFASSSVTTSSTSSEQVEIQMYLSKLKELVPHMPRHRKVSKLEVIQHVIDYICDLQTALEQKQQRQQAAAIARQRRVHWRRRSHNPQSTATPTTESTSTTSILQPLGNLSAIPPSHHDQDVIFHFFIQILKFQLFFFYSKVCCDVIMGHLSS